MKISVIIPCYNGARFLGDAIQSALRQTYRPWQVIVVDDGSTDESAAIAKSFRDVTVVQHENRGLPAARNSGIAVATGDYFYFLDADDLVAAQAFEKMVSAVADIPDAVALMGFAVFDTDPSRPTVINVPRSEDFFPDLIANNIGTPHTWLIPSRVVRDIGGFRAGMPMFEDWECWCRVALHGVPLRTVDFPGALYRRHSASMSLTANRARFIRGHVRVMQTLCEGLLGRAELPAAHAEQLFWSTWTAYARAKTFGLAPEDLAPLAKYLEDLSRLQGTSNRFATMIRWLGIKAAGGLRGLVERTALNGLPS